VRKAKAKKEKGDKPMKTKTNVKAGNVVWGT
jgi:hypothetical protein